MGTTAFMTLGAVLAGVAGVVVGAVLVRRRGPTSVRRRLAEVVATLVALGAVLALTVAATWARGVDFRWFAAVHVAYLGLVVSAPILGLGVLVATLRHRLPTVALVAAVVLLMLAPVGWYATHWAPFALRVSTADVALPPERAGHDPVRIGVMADLQTNHIGSYERRVVRTLQAQHPDLIVIPGDLFQGSDAQFAAVLPHYRALLRQLHAPHGVYAVQGDAESAQRLQLLVAGTGIQLLNDRIVSLHVGDRHVLLAGNELRWAPPEGLEIREQLIDADPAAVRVLVAHRPEVVLGLPMNSGVDVVIAGHTHGGQVALPLLGPIVKFSPVSRKVAGGGLHEVHGNPIYVSTGAGMVRAQAPQIRFLTRPSVGLVTLDGP